MLLPTFRCSLYRRTLCFCLCAALVALLDTIRFFHWHVSVNNLKNVRLGRLWLLLTVFRFISVMLWTYCDVGWWKWIQLAFCFYGPTAFLWQTVSLCLHQCIWVRITKISRSRYFVWTKKLFVRRYLLGNIQIKLFYYLKWCLDSLWGHVYKWKFC